MQRSQRGPGPEKEPFLFDISPQGEEKPVPMPLPEDEPKPPVETPQKQKGLERDYGTTPDGRPINPPDVEDQWRGPGF